MSCRKEQTVSSFQKLARGSLVGGWRAEQGQDSTRVPVSLKGGM